MSLLCMVYVCALAILLSSRCLQMRAWFVLLAILLFGMCDAATLHGACSRARDLIC